MYQKIILVVALLVPLTGCVKSVDQGSSAPFESKEYDAILSIVIDQSSSFDAQWTAKAYTFFLKLMDQYFRETAGSDVKVILSQMSGSDQVVVFDGTPNELRAKFKSPDDLHVYLSDFADPSSTRVYHAIKKTVDYMKSRQGITDNTKMLTVVLSDLRDTEHDLKERNKIGNGMIASLSVYREMNGAVALYYADPERNSHWQSIFKKAGFEPGYYVIENRLSENPQLPKLY